MTGILLTTNLSGKAFKKLKLILGVQLPNLVRNLLRSNSPWQVLLTFHLFREMEEEDKRLNNQIILISLCQKQTTLM